MVTFKLTIYINNKFMNNLIIFMPSIEGGGANALDEFVRITKNRSLICFTINEAIK